MATPRSPCWQIKPEATKYSNSQQESPYAEIDSVKKNLFGPVESDPCVDDACSFSYSSEYFSQSSMELDLSRTSKRLLFESPPQVSFNSS